MNAELRETLELARVLDVIITISEHHMPSVPVRRAAERVREHLVDGVRVAIDELARAWPASDPAEIKRFRESLDKGQIPKSTAALGDFLPRLLDEEITKLESGIKKARRRVEPAMD